MHVRPANKFDIQQSAFLWYERIALLQQTDSYFTPLPSATQIWEQTANNWIDDETVGFFAAELDSNIIGYIVVTIIDGPIGLRPKYLGKIIDMAIDLHQPHKGLGGTLIHHAKQWFANKGIQVLTVDLPAGYPVEEAFWRSQGAKVRFNEYWMLI